MALGASLALIEDSVLKGVLPCAGPWQKTHDVCGENSKHALREHDAAGHPICAMRKTIMSASVATFAVSLGFIRCSLWTSACGAPAVDPSTQGTKLNAE